MKHYSGFRSSVFCPLSKECTEVYNRRNLHPVFQDQNYKSGLLSFGEAFWRSLRYSWQNCWPCRDRASSRSARSTLLSWQWLFLCHFVALFFDLFGCKSGVRYSHWHCCHNSDGRKRPNGVYQYIGDDHPPPLLDAFLSCLRRFFFCFLCFVKTAVHVNQRDRKYTLTNIRSLLAQLTQVLAQLQAGYPVVM